MQHIFNFGPGSRALFIFHSNTAQLSPPHRRQKPIRRLTAEKIATKKAKNKARRAQQKKRKADAAAKIAREAKVEAKEKDLKQTDLKQERT
ncbi:hypothetical protein RBB50_005127 [Rhinocladiella similis]